MPSSEELYCSDCGEEFTDWDVRNGSPRSPVDHIVEYSCPNGHLGRENFGIDGNLMSSRGITRVMQDA